MQNDAAATPILSPSITDRPTGLGATIAMYGPLILVVFLIVIYKIESSDQSSSTLNDTLPSLESSDTKEIATPAQAPLNTSASGQAVALAKTPPTPNSPPIPYPGWGPPIPGGAYWGGIPNQGPTSSSTAPPSFYPYPYYSPHPYPPYGIDPYWWTGPGEATRPPSR